MLPRPPRFPEKAPVGKPRFIWDSKLQGSGHNYQIHLFAWRNESFRLPMPQRKGPAGWRWGMKWKASKPWNYKPSSYKAAIPMNFCVNKPMTCSTRHRKAWMTKQTTAQCEGQKPLWTAKFNVKHTPRCKTQSAVWNIHEHTWTVTGTSLWTTDPNVKHARTHAPRIKRRTGWEIRAFALAQTFQNEMRVWCSQVPSNFFSVSSAGRRRCGSLRIEGAQN